MITADEIKSADFALKLALLDDDFRAEVEAAANDPQALQALRELFTPQKIQWMLALAGAQMMKMALLVHDNPTARKVIADKLWDDAQRQEVAA